MPNNIKDTDKLGYEIPTLMFLDLGNANVVAGGSPKVSEEGAPDSNDGDDFSGDLG